MDVAESRSDPTRFSRRLFSGLPERYDRLATWLSLGQDPRWRTELLRHVAVAPSGVALDVACGPGAVTLALARRDEGRVVGLDVSREMLGQGAANASEAGLASRVAHVLGRGEELPFADGAFQALTFTYLLRYVADPAATLHELARVVEPGAPVASLEFSVPPNIAWRWLWRAYTRGVLPIAGLALGGRAWYDVGRFLGPSIDAHERRYPRDWLVAAWREAGFTGVESRSMSLGGGLVVWGTKR